MRITRLFCVAWIVAVVAGLGIVLAAEDGPACDELRKAPEKYVGKQVSFFAMRAGMEMGDGQVKSSYSCKTKEGKDVPGGMFMFISSEATFTSEAGKDLRKLAHVTGTVKGVGIMNFGGGSTAEFPLLDKVKVQLATQAK